MKIRLAPEAEADLTATLEFIRERNPAAATKLANRVFATLKKLATDRVAGPEYRLTTGDASTPAARTTTAVVACP